ncbi:MAG: hypothetical protein KDD50_12405 [Bdellovibrionales bacterium]|nr:hypothetical protein [Bdellovibrionales bacterium]
MTSLFMSALGSYAIANVPLPWLSNVSFVVLSIWVLATSHKKMVPGVVLLSTFLLWATAITLLNMVFKNYSIFIPQNATTNYMFYVSLRLFNIIVFSATLYLTYWICLVAESKKLIEDILFIATIIGLYSIYVYIAQTNGLPEIPRNRLGTGGEEQSTTFSYAFHRAMGTFREPSHLAEWIVLPLILSFIYTDLKGRLRSFLLTIVMMLTGSLTGISSLVLGIVTSNFMDLQGLVNRINRNIKLIFIIGFSLVCFNLIVAGTSKSSHGLIETLWDRIEPIVEDDGLKSSNRNYVYEYSEQVSFPFLGAGLGHSNLLFTKYLDLNIVASFLNLYLNIGYSMGWIGLFILFLLFFLPIYLYYSNNNIQNKSYVMLLFSAYFSWLVIFYVHAEELSIIFSVTFGILLYELKKSTRLIAHEK